MKNKIFNSIFKFSILVLFFFPTTFSCKKDSIEKNNDGIIVYVPFDWELKISDLTHNNSIIRAHLIEQEFVYLATVKVGNYYLTKVAVPTGKIIWDWNDVYQYETEFVDINHWYLYNNCLLYQVGSRSYSINLNTGKTQWKIRHENTFDSELTGSGDEDYFLVGRPTDTLTNFNSTIIFKGDANSGELERYLVPYYDTSFIPKSLRIGDVSGCIPIIFNNSERLIMIYQQQTADNPITFQSYLATYDVEGKFWIYERKILCPNLQNGVLLNDPITFNNKVYLNIGHEIICASVEDGSVLWRIDFHADFSFSGFIIEDDQILANCEDGVFYCIDPNTGNIKWHTEGAGTSSPLRYLNGIVYFSGGSTGRIHGIDANTGKYVWRLEPDKYDNASDFKPDIYVAPGENGEKGKVIICTPEKAYCLPAYR